MKKDFVLRGSKQNFEYHVTCGNQDNQDRPEGVHYLHIPKWIFFRVMAFSLGREKPVLSSIGLDSLVFKSAWMDVLVQAG
jgi:hypothetical protein